MRILLLLCNTAAFLALWCAGCATDAPEPYLPEDVGQTVEGPGLVSRGAHLYMKYCQPCHGAEGKGDGPAADVLDTPPRDLTAGQFKFRSTPMGSSPTAGDLYRVIALGVPGTEMPAWGDRLGEQEMWSIAAYVQTLEPGFGDEATRPKPEAVIDIPAPPELGADAVASGQKLFGQFGCTSCHGEDGRGGGPSAADLEDYTGRPIAPPDFSTGVYKSGPRPRDLYRTIATGVSGVPMPGYAGALKPDQIWQVVAYIRSLRQERGVFDYLLATDPGRL
ncbi:c-type cytochrome [Persicimonas caeni]|nr:c-type cytochrome [Persicimonas caeni]